MYGIPLIVVICFLRGLCYYVQYSARKSTTHIYKYLREFMKTHSFSFVDCIHLDERLQQELVILLSSSALLSSPDVSPNQLKRRQTSRLQSTKWSGLRRTSSEWPTTLWTAPTCELSSRDTIPR